MRVESPEAAATLIAKLNGYCHCIGGVVKRLKVAHARPRSKSRRGGKCFIANLSVWVEAEDIAALLQSFGTVLDSKVLKGVWMHVREGRGGGAAGGGGGCRGCRLVRNLFTQCPLSLDADAHGRSKGCGFVRFAFRREAVAAVQALHSKRITLSGSSGAFEAQSGWDVLPLLGVHDRLFMSRSPGEVRLVSDRLRVGLAEAEPSSRDRRGRRGSGQSRRRGSDASSVSPTASATSITPSSCASASLSPACSRRSMSPSPSDFPIHHPMVRVTSPPKYPAFATRSAPVHTTTVPTLRSTVAGLTPVPMPAPTPAMPSHWHPGVQPQYATSGTYIRAAPPMPPHPSVAHQPRPSFGSNMRDFPSAPAVVPMDIGSPPGFSHSH